jgi:acetyl-CoA carboxylase biotin carboxylase subunit
VDESLRQRLGEAALAVARAARYQNAGTVEFLVDTSSPTGRDFFFLEMNTRLQVEHPITEMVTGIDLVQEQLRIASGHALSHAQHQIQFRGAALECRIYAEDPAQDFYPSPGLVTTLFEPSGPGIRNDSGLYAGFSIPLEYDPLISKLVAFGQNRSRAIERMRRAIGEYKVGGVKTTIHFFERLLSHPEFLAGNLHTGFIEEHQLTSPGSASDQAPPFIPLAAASVEYLLRRQARPKLRAGAVSNWRNLSWKQP